MLIAKELKPALLLGSLLLGLSGCGVMDLGSSLDSAQDGKNPCPGDHQGFYICMSNASVIHDLSLQNTIVDGLAKLISLVNTTSFQSQVEGFYTSGNSIVDNLTSTNYIVTITGYCDPTSTVLASAIVGGDTISYNECTVEKDANGNPDLAEVSGVLLHEISHNIGYTHPSVNPSPTTVPYWLGDTAQDDIDPSAASPTTGKSGGSSGARHYVIGD